MSLSSWFRSLDSMSTRFRSGRSIRRLPGKRKVCRTLFFVERLEDRTLLDAVHWIGGSGKWSDPSHWDMHVPGPSDTAIIDATGADYTVTLDTSATVAGFTLNSSNAMFYMYGQTFTVNGDAMLSAGTVLWTYYGTWTESGTLTNSATVIASVGSETFNGTFANAVGGTLQVQSSDAPNQNSRGDASLTANRQRIVSF
jgi:hypothetical protein